MADPIKPDANGTKSQTRGISYPFIGLEEAVEKAKAFHAAERKASVPVVSAMRHFGYSEKSGAGRQTVSALIQFGLLDDQGTKEDRLVKLTERALVILFDLPDSPARIAALREAVTSPKIYSELLSKWPEGLPSDHTISFYLQKDKDFNPKTLQSFITDFRASLAFAKLGETATIAPDKPPIPPAFGADGFPSPKVKVGDYVQWESGGVVQFTEPRLVTGISDEGTYAFIVGTNSGVPVKELTIMNLPQVPQTPPPTTAGQMPTPTTPVIRAIAGSRQDTFSLDEGNVILQWPDKMSAESFIDFESWMQLQLRKIKRSIN